MLLMISAFGAFLAIAGLVLAVPIVGVSFGGEIIGAVCVVLVGLGLVAFL